MEQHYNKLQGNPTLINGFEDVINYIKNQEAEIKRLKENLERVTKVRDDFAHTCAALNTALDIVEYNGVVSITKEELNENIESRGEPDNDKLVKILYEFYEFDEDNQ
jgi:hypothetical protein